MSNILECYKILGVSAGAGFADVTTSYKSLCRIHHPDVSSDPESEELMKSINIAYAVLREKFRREALLRERQTFARQTRRYTGFETRATGAYARKQPATEAEKEASTVLQGYFRALGACDYSGAYSYLSSYDRRQVTRESFIKWRKSVERLYIMREFRVKGESASATVSFNNGRTVHARKFRVEVTEQDLSDDVTRSSELEKLVINDNGLWRVFLGYRGVGELTRSFDERFEEERRRDSAKRWQEYNAGLHPEYNMFSLAGLRNAASREVYRQGRFGGTLTFAAISVRCSGDGESEQEDTLLRSAARTIRSALRETDVPAYLGDGVFAVLFVELRKKNAEEIITRLSKKIRGNAGPRLGIQADIRHAFESWTAASPADMDGINTVLKTFDKKL
ncbi:MAG: DnaJ domain-containing protein [Oscillospiraceae bacterium]|jgi:curved DNA-binding protein CbpA|nr:DnaJ domain-containing protein [Oscillospiraceae bacterium]